MSVSATTDGSPAGTAAVPRQAAPQGLALENYANNSSPPPARARRYARRAYLWDFSHLARLRKCGRVRRSTHVGVRATAQAAGFSGLCSCGSVWACPVCNAKIMARRSLEIGAAISAHMSCGGSVGFVTLTMRHRKGQRLADLWDALRDAWGAATSGKTWSKQKGRAGYVGHLRVVEVTYGANGWHVHVHALVFLDSADVDRLQRLFVGMFTRWSRSLVRSGLSAPTPVGQDCRLVDGVADAVLAEYLSKTTDRLPKDLGAEMTQTQSKTARTVHATRPPWDLLTDLFDHGDADAGDLWHEWEQGSANRKQLTWSQGLRDLLGLNREQDDEDVAAEDLGDHDLVIIPGHVWDDDVVRRPHLIPQILDAAQHGTPVLRAFLVTHGIDHQEPS